MVENGKPTDPGTRKRSIAMLTHFSEAAGPAAEMCEHEHCPRSVRAGSDELLNKIRNAHRPSIV